MVEAGSDGQAPNGWRPIEDSPEAYSSGTPALDRLLGGGYPRGGLALLHADPAVAPDDLDLLVAPTVLNFLHHSRGAMVLLPPRDDPTSFRRRLTRFTTRRRFDTRIRIVDYSGAFDQLPYVTTIERGTKDRKIDLAKFGAAERAASGGRGRPYLELHAITLLELLVGAEKAARMIYFGVQRAQRVGNLILGILSPGLGCAPIVRAMAKVELAVDRGPRGVTVRGLRPEFPAHRLARDSPERSAAIRLVKAGPG